VGTLAAKFMDPIKEGVKIFKDVVEKVGIEHTRDIKEAKRFLDALVDATRGLVIVDFLDARNWDKIEKIEILEKEGYLFFHWHDYRTIEEHPDDKMMRQMVFPGNLYSALIHFNELRIVPTDYFPLILLRGHAIKDKEVKKLFPDALEFAIRDDEDNFSKKAIVKRAHGWELYDCLNTPIFSVIIIPKNCGASSGDSKDVLYSYNLHDALSRLDKVKTELEQENLTDPDVICEKANTVRRIFEYVLKVECCYRYRQISVKKDYSDLLLGDLIGLIKEFREDYIKDMLTKIVIWANELSHDSGKPIRREKASLLTLMAMTYTDLLKQEIKLNPYPHLDI